MNEIELLKVSQLKLRWKDIKTLPFKFYFHV